MYRDCTLVVLLSALVVGASVSRAATTALPTIDLIEVETSSPALPHSYNPGGSFLLLVEEVARVHLSTGDIGKFGAGGSSGSVTTYNSTFQSGGQLQFIMGPISGGKFYERVSFSSPLPDVRTGFRLDLLGPLSLVTTTGSFEAVLSGSLVVSRNGLAPPFEGTDAALLGAEQGGTVPFSVTYTKLGSAWAADSFESPFDYTFAASIVTAAVPEPGVTTLFAVALVLPVLLRKRAFQVR
jgi:hypothetical protein